MYNSQRMCHEHLLFVCVKFYFILDDWKTLSGVLDTNFHQQT